jgi:hypothetical protein
MGHECLNGRGYQQTHNNGALLSPDIGKLLVGRTLNAGMRDTRDRATAHEWSDAFARHFWEWRP